MGALRFILGDQLSDNVSALSGADPKTDVIVMAEVADEANYVRHHKKKIAFLFSAMRHFADRLRDKGFKIDYRAFGDHDHESLGDVLADAVKKHKPDCIVLTRAAEWRVVQMQEEWCDAFDLPVVLREDDRFLATTAEFAKWAEGRKELRMEYFYREMRRKTGLLMDGDEPAGGQWNFDKDNRDTPDADLEPPQRPAFEPDETTCEVLDLVGDRFAENFGELEGFSYPVTHDGAAKYLDWFVEKALPDFGQYQDAMVSGEPLMFHSHLSALINAGLLDPMDACKRAEKAWQDGKAPLNSVEGFIRQIIGWREYIRGIYWLKMPDYADENAFSATRDLPDWFWTGETRMNCLRQAIRETRENAYAHHIQRLMVIGNFSLLSALDPKQVQEWFLAVYFDAYEWVEMPNVLGMALYADGGQLASKPYAASGAYMNRMSTYCGDCSYAVTKKNGPKACPLNYLYWDFLERNREKLKGNHRLGMIYKTLDKMDEEKRSAVKEDSRRFLKAINEA